MTSAFRQRLLMCIAVAFSILLADQILKIWVKTTFLYGEELHVFGNWFILHFTENNGMAFGLEFGGTMGKILLSLFRIAAVLAIGWFILKLIRQGAPKGLLVSMSMIFAGAFGNIIDSLFYGILFSESFIDRVAEFMPAEGGYAPLLYGKVVDMLYFPIIKGYIPDWMPFWKSEYFIFFRPVFNIADSAITCGIAIILLFQKKFFTYFN